MNNSKHDQPETHRSIEIYYFCNTQERWLPVLYGCSWWLQHAARAVLQGLVEAFTIPHVQQQTKATP